MTEKIRSRRRRRREAEDALLRTCLVLFVIEKLAISSVSLKGIMEGEYSTI